MKLEFDFYAVSVKLNPNGDAHMFFSICTIIGVKIVDKMSSNGIKFGEQKNSQPCIQSWGLCYFLQVARTAAQHCMARVRKGKLYFLLFKLAKCQSRPFGQKASPNFVADCSSSL